MLVQLIVALVCDIFTAVTDVGGIQLIVEQLEITCALIVPTDEQPVIVLVTL